jgi:CheY-like chemotaxis protein
MFENSRVLVVDDDAAVGRSITRVLSDRGFKVREALDGKEALDEMGHQDYDVVFTDIKMPGMDGLEVASRVRKEHPGVPVVIVTGYGTDANEARAREIGVSAFLRKPLTPTMIVENAELALRERAEIMEAVRQSALALAAPAVAPAPAVEAAAAVEAAVEPRENVAKNIALFFAAPFIGLAYIIAFPFVGAWMLAKYLWKSAFHAG